MRVGVAIGLGIGLLLVAAVLVLERRSHHVVGTNLLSEQQFVAMVPSGDLLCQGGEEVPERTGRIGLRIGTHDDPGPGLHVELRADERVVGRGRLRPGWIQGDVTIPLDRPLERAETATLCVHNRGPARLAVAGEPTADPARRARITGRVAPGLVRVEYRERRSRTWLQQAGTVLENSGRGKAAHLGGGWTLWAAALALLAAWVIAVRVLLRREP